jgi:Do/DeqQ family serine protease
MKKLLAVSLILVSMTSLGVANVHALSEEASNGGVPSLAPMLENVTPAVVIVSTSQQAEAPEQLRYFNEEELRRFFNSPDGQVPPGLPGGNGRGGNGPGGSGPGGNGPGGNGSGGEVRGTGSGVIVDAAKGYIVTNHHVIDNADKITVALQDGREYQAKLIGSDASTDVALLQIEADGLQALSFANIDNLRVGDYVVAIGNPFGIGQTVTSGIVSALGRGGLNNENYEDFIQTDAAINVGNSGGALVDLEGRLIGINTAIISGSGSSAGIAFAVPVDMIAAVMEHLERDGEVRRGQLGVQIQDLTSAMESTLKTGAGKGALVTSVIPGSAAEAAGVQVSDVIVEIAGRKVESGRELRNIVGLLRRSEEVELVLFRDGNREQIKAVIGGEDRSVAAVQTDAEEGRGLDEPDFQGARLSTLDPSSAIARAAGVSAGIEVLDVDEQSPAFRAGLRAGDIIQQINRSTVTKLGEFNAMVSEDSQVTVLGVLREGRQLLVILS